MAKKVKVKSRLRKGKFVKEHLRNNNWAESGQRLEVPYTTSREEDKSIIYTTMLPSEILRITNGAAIKELKVFSQKGLLKLIEPHGIDVPRVEIV